MNKKKLIFYAALALWATALVTFLYMIFDLPTWKIVITVIAVFIMLQIEVIDFDI